MKTSLICTVLNEKKTVADLIHSIVNQSENPDEVVLIDGGSTDDTVETIKSIITRLPQSKMKWILFSKKSNRAEGRNAAIKKARGQIILVTDAGCVLDSQWVRYMTKPFAHSLVQVVAGNNKAMAKTVFQKCVAPYALVMQNRIHPETFLPSTRAIAFRKSIWERLGGFPKDYPRNEDYVFARRLRNLNIPITYSKEAVVYWTPPTNLLQTYKMFCRHAYGDVEAKILRPKVALLFLRYLIALFFLLFILFTHQYGLFSVLGMLLLLYVLWAIEKNYQYVRRIEAIYLLPLLQFTADIAVITASLQGLYHLAFVHHGGH